MEKNERFGGLVYVSEQFYTFVLRLELVFKKFLLPEYLAVYGSMIVGRLYDGIKQCEEVYKYVGTMIAGGDQFDDAVNDETIRNVSVYLVRTYCQMRGKDFVRKLLSQSASQINSQKPIRQVMAVKTGEVTAKKSKRAILSMEAIVDDLIESSD